MSAASSLDEWLHRAGSLMPAREVLPLFTPPVMVEKLAKYALSRHKREALADDPSKREPELVALLLDVARFLGRHYFRLEVRGIEHVPQAGPLLLVGNHNGGLVPTDSFFTALAILDRFGPRRAVYGLGHDFLFYDALLRRYAMRIGLLRAGHESASHVFDRGDIVLVYPGSDLETFRPWRERARVDLGGRTGFLRLALRAGVPIVPVVSAGTHEQFVVLTRGDRLAQLLHMHRWARTCVCPLVFALPWGITSGFVPYLPLPAQTTVAFGRPMTWPGLDARAADDRDALERCYHDVERTMQSMLDELYEGRRPFLGQPSAAHPAAPAGLSSCRPTRGATE
jgi:1-acyl-sn-glycerol-3-phosphate acyltransferase